MNEERGALDELVSTLKQSRDELKLRIHLADMEAKEEYERLSTKVDQLADQYEPVKDAAVEAAGNIWSALKLAGDEMAEGLSKVRKSLEE